MAELDRAPGPEHFDNETDGVLDADAVQDRDGVLDADAVQDRDGVLDADAVQDRDGVLDADAVELVVPPPRANGSVLMAAMLGLAQALGMEEKPSNVEAVQPAEPLDDPVKLDFGSLRPLDE